ncbi:hypothetical protein A2690_00920 [Candidatus Roizmanbacteria bacterium RIFCSPHIGHO2_01_FULL_39_12b]|uniref:DUF86 domain-containing protein n=1 Tax=Candidatus Roizmanbacteria bacterium RIFCSPHIGHO2_01_FULL_39_12b TaxID=1802030 RepID=A0A1F7GAT1_9BACT|nr:MAG: hypothetical protein A2690_00920 [Candidatus Roizmanbacteria bacterium RIFCSPHIGHO2_01_FULL_39_12b]
MQSQPNNIDKINLRIEALKRYLRRLEELRTTDANTLIKNEDLAAVVEHRLHLAIEACIDIAELIIVDQSLKTPGSYRETIEILGSSGVIDRQFAQQFSNAVSFRNILIHDYVNVDYHKVAQYLKENLKDFHRFIKEVLAYLK